MTQYMGSDLWREDVRKAQENWLVTVQLQDGQPGPRGAAHEFDGDWLTRYVEAQADTGSRYAVLVTRLGGAELRLGGDVMVTVVQPWQDAHPLQSDGMLHASYVAEHLTAGRLRERTLHGGDLAALTLTIAHALGREAVIDVA